MKKRRRRWFRDETVAPWATVAVILAMWWGASWLIRPGSDAESDAFDGTTAVDARRVPGGVDAPDVPRSSREEPRPDGPTEFGDLPPAPDRANDVSGVARPGALDDRRDPTPASMTTSSTGHLVPVAGVDSSELTSTFDAERGAGTRRHEAMDIMAPRGTPVLASVAGRIVKLFTSAAGGLTVYQFDEQEQYCYYYAHLDAYAPDLTEGQVVEQGQIIGFVGTTGNAPANAPHLHFAILRLGPDKRWWEGEALDPLTFLR